MTGIRASMPNPSYPSASEISEPIASPAKVYPGACE